MQQLFCGIRVLTLTLTLLIANSYIFSQTTNNADTNTYLKSFYERDITINTNEATIENINPFFTIIKLFIYLIIIGVITFLIIRYLIKKNTLPVSEDENLIELIYRKSIAPGCYLNIVKVGTIYYILSLSSDGVRYIDKITDKETIDFIELNKDKLKAKDYKFIDLIDFLNIKPKKDQKQLIKEYEERLKKL